MICEDVYEALRAYNSPYNHMFKKEKVEPLEINEVIFDNPATIVKWSDGTKTVVKVAKGDTYDWEKGLAMAICKKFFGNNNKFHKIFKKFEPEVVEEEEPQEKTNITIIKDVKCISCKFGDVLQCDPPCITCFSPNFSKWEAKK